MSIFSYVYRSSSKLELYVNAKRSINLPYRLPDFTPENLLFRYCSLCYTIFYFACRESSLDILFLILVWVQKKCFKKEKL